MTLLDDDDAGTSTIIAELGAANDDKTRYITGAPRSGDIGEVFIYRAVGETKNNKRLELQQTLGGEQFGSWFGGALAVLDLNADG